MNAALAARPYWVRFELSTLSDPLAHPARTRSIQERSSIRAWGVTSPAVMLLL
jgi:hypothetical protein